MRIWILLTICPHFHCSKLIHTVSLFFSYIISESSGRPSLAGPTESSCPEGLLMYTCERTGPITIIAQAIIVWSFVSNNGELLGGATPVRTLNESTPVQLAEGFTLTGNVSSSGAVTAVLQVNASSDYNGAMVTCYINGGSNTLTVSIRGESIYWAVLVTVLTLATDPVPPVMSSLEATGSPGAQNSSLTLLSWRSTPPADSCTITITPSPPGYTRTLTSPTTNITVSVLVNLLYSVSVYGSSCRISGDSISITYMIGECTMVSYVIGSEKRDNFTTKIISEFSIPSKRTFLKLQNGF